MAFLKIGENGMKTERKKSACKKSGDAAITSLWEQFAVDRTNVELRKQLIGHYMWLVNRIARRTKNNMPDEVEVDDLTSDGVLGLMDAIDNFDVKRGFKFETFGAPRIWGAIIDGLRRMDWVPRLTRSKTAKLTRERDLLALKLSRQPSQEEVAEHLGVDSDRYFKIERNATPVSVTSLQEERNNITTEDFKLMFQGDLLKDSSAGDPTSGVGKDDFLKLVVKGLNPTEKIIVFLYYYCDQTMRQIGQQLGLSESRVSQIHSDIISRLRKKPRSRQYELAELVTAA